MGTSEGNSVGLLNDFYRHLLKRGEWDRKRRERFRNRIRRSLADFNEVNRHIEDRDLKQIFDKRVLDSDQVVTNQYYGEVEPEGEAELSDTMMARINATHAIEFFWRGLRAIGNEPYEIMGDVIVKGILRGEATHKDVHENMVYLDVDVDDTTESVKLDVRVRPEAELAPLDKYRQGVPLTLDERHAINQQLLDHISEAEYMEHMAEGELEEIETASGTGYRNSAWDELVETYLLDD